MSQHSRDRNSAEHQGRQGAGPARRRWLHWLAVAAAFLGAPTLVAAWRLHGLNQGPHPAPQPLASSEVSLPAVPRHDPTKPTVAIILGADLTEITDALGPYEIFSRAGTFNVYTTAAQRRPTLLSPTLLPGGVRILPHYSLAELDALLGGKPPAIVVVPNIPNIADSENQPLIAWMKRQARAGSLMHSWCTGAMALAQAGILDGLTATAHWGDLSRLAQRYPQVEWVRGVRWVDHGQVITSAGITSGIDASLRVLSKIVGQDIAERVAAELRYPNLRFSREPAVTAYATRPADAIILANLSFRLRRQQIGVALYDGVDEMDLTGLYDAYAGSAAADLHTVTASSSAVRTAHGLVLLSSLTVSGTTASGSSARIRDLDRIIVPGRNAAMHGAEVSGALRSLAPALEQTYVHAADDHRFSLEPVIEDLARRADLPTARFALRRLEYRSDTIRLEGSAVPWSILPLALGLGSLGSFIVLALGAILRRHGKALSARRASATISRAHAT